MAEKKHVSSSLASKCVSSSLASRSLSWPFPLWQPQGSRASTLGSPPAPGKSRGHVCGGCRHPHTSSGSHLQIPLCVNLSRLLEPVYTAGPAHLGANSFQMFPPRCVDSGRLWLNLKSLP